MTDIDDEAPVFTSIGDFSAMVTATDIDSDDESIRFNSSELKISRQVQLKPRTYRHLMQQMTDIDDLDDVAPVFTSEENFVVEENQIAIGTVTATDIDTDSESIIYSVSGLELSITPDGLLSFVSAPDYETKSSYSAMVTATDGINSSVQEITVNVTDANEATGVYFHWRL